MKKSKDPCEIALEEQDESPPESPAGPVIAVSDDMDTNSNVKPVSVGSAGPIGKNKEDDDEEENVDVELGKLQPIGDPEKTAKMQELLAHFTQEQMNRYESFRRSGFQRANMKRLLTNITGSSKVYVPVTIVMSGVAKMFVGELIEMARVVMAERRDTGPIRPCHIRESYRRLKLEGKTPKRSMSRLFR
ncbi:transcription initiation factor TFIID subunit 11 [Castilleja foliolosa]|uniref:Transcription initiation factor TFIID subunit 11 n=1 Tax=Castilleja foliolosa TaxID=1961234 RepID=A0ABD3DE49_9LAMI